MIRIFKKGDKVMHKENHQEMEVVSYFVKYDIQLGPKVSMNDVICKWEDENGEPKVAIFNQHDLKKVEEPADLPRK